MIFEDLSSTLLSNSGKREIAVQAVKHSEWWCSYDLLEFAA